MHLFQAIMLETSITIAAMAINSIINHIHPNIISPPIPTYIPETKQFKTCTFKSPQLTILTFGTTQISKTGTCQT